MGWTRWHMDTGMRSPRDVKPARRWMLKLRSYSTPGPHPEEAGCPLVPLADLLEQSLAVEHRRPAGSTTRVRRAWSPSVPASTL